MKTQEIVSAYTVDYNSGHYNGGPIEEFILPEQQEELDKFITHCESQYHDCVVLVKVIRYLSFDEECPWPNDAVEEDGSCSQCGGFH